MEAGPATEQAPPPAAPDRSALIGAAVAGAGGVLLFVSLFMTWYELSASGLVEDVGGPVGDVLGIDVREMITRSGWESFEVLDVICVAAALIAAARAAVALLGSEDNPSIPGSMLTLALGAVALAGILYRVVNPPGVGMERELGLWVGAFAAAAIAYGSFQAMQAGRS